MTVIINGSPKAAGSATEVLMDLLIEKLDDKEKVVFSTRAPDLDALERCDQLVMVFPLYVDGIPSNLLRVLIACESRLSGSGKRVYGVVHCGFCEGKQCRWALENLRHFCRRAGLVFMGGVGLGSGMMLMPSQGLPAPVTRPLMELLSETARAVNLEQKILPYRYGGPGLPRRLFTVAGNMSWKQAAKANGLPVKALYRTEE